MAQLVFCHLAIVEHVPKLIVDRQVCFVKVLERTYTQSAQFVLIVKLLQSFAGVCFKVPKGMVQVKKQVFIVFHSIKLVAVPKAKRCEDTATLTIVCLLYTLLFNGKLALYCLFLKII